MIKVFTLNKNGKIELTKEEVEKMLNEAYWDGYWHNNSWVYTSSSITCDKTNAFPNYITTATTTSINTTINSDENKWTYKTADVKL